MIQGVNIRFEIGPDEELAVNVNDKFPIAINQWKIVADLLAKARGVVVAKDERIRPLWMIIANGNDQPIPLAIIHYRIELETGLSEDTYVLNGDLPVQDIQPRGDAKLLCWIPMLGSRLNAMW